MAVVHVTMPDKRSCGELAAVARDAELTRAARQLELARLRPGRGLSLTATELLELHDRRDLAPPRVRPVLDAAAVKLAQAQAYEQVRDDEVKPALAKRRDELQREFARA